MRNTNSFFISVGIHLSLAALMIGALSAVHKNTPVAEDKIAVRLLSPLSTPELPIPVAKSEPLAHSETLQPTPKTLETAIAQPKKTVAEQSKPIINTPVQPASTATSSTSTLPVAKAAEQPVQSSVVKTAPSAPKPQENYEEENLGRIRTILMEKLVYPKNALRLKQQGEVTVTFTLEPTREVNQISISKSSGFDLLDNAAKALVETSANEFPKPSKSVRISVPIAYKLR